MTAAAIANIQSMECGILAQIGTGTVRTGKRKTMTSEAYCMDCLVAMRDMKDGEFDLAVVDPPYGFANDNGGKGRFGGRFNRYIQDEERATTRKSERVGNGWAHKYGRQQLTWDEAPPQEYFDELFRVSKNQIIWGGNYFWLPPTRCFLIWNKKKHIGQVFYGYVRVCLD